MLSLADIQKRLSQLQYFPGWKLSAYEGAFEGPKLHIEAHIEDYTGKDNDFVFDARIPIDPLFENVHQFDVWLIRRLNRIAVHESMEALREIKTGKPVIDPHREFADRDLI